VRRAPEGGGTGSLAQEEGRISVDWVAKEKRRGSGERGQDEHADAAEHPRHVIFDLTPEEARRGADRADDRPQQQSPGEEQRVNHVLDAD
jgi:hypothetical protein